MALHQYANANAGQYPNIWAQLYPKFLGDDSNYITEIFRCAEHACGPNYGASSVASYLSLTAQIR